jgi:hypothetical protein
MDIKTFVDVISLLPPHIAVLSKGPTGIGKSAVVHQIGEKLGLEVIDRRLSYMTEGDLIGLPELIDGVTRFAPIDWFIRACNEPLIVFFDELNRATIEVQQCAFQIVLDRELNGHKLHPETRIYAAVNEGNDYQVTEMDPALLRRFYSATLEPTVDDWLKWAESRGNVHEIITAFIRKYPAHLRHEGDMTPGKVYPNPASWSRLDQSLKYANIDLSVDVGSCYKSITSPISLGFIGDETTIAFSSYLKNLANLFNAKDVVQSYGTLKPKLDKLNNDKKNDLLNQVFNLILKESISVNEAKNIFEFSKNASDEMCVSFYYQLLGIDINGDNDIAIANLKKLTNYFSSTIVEVYNKTQK